VPAVSSPAVPEVLEIEYYRRLAEGAIGRAISVVDAPDAWFLKGGLTSAALADVLVGTTFVAAERRGKLLLLPTDRGPVLGLRFGMTGRLVLDGRAGIDRLAYASSREVAAWERLRVEFDDGGALVLVDARRLGGVVLDPPLEGLGPDVLSVRPAELAAALAASRAPLKARLMDQARLAGLGNLLVDEILWRAGLDPARPAGGLTPAELRRLHRHLRATLAELIASGGSHLGGLMAARERGGRCPRDGAELERRTIGGRTTYSCPQHQR
jgi:formamidopyrimidine-DNA glycosylase